MDWTRLTAVSVVGRSAAGQEKLGSIPSVLLGGGKAAIRGAGLAGESLLATGLKHPGLALGAVGAGVVTPYLAESTARTLAREIQRHNARLNRPSIRGALF